jgi:aryl-alcohol dehydrogenase-like predicted oxidoreductase
MEYRQLGASGFRVPVLSLGTGTFGGGGAALQVPGAAVTWRKRRGLWTFAWRRGSTMFDSADVYSSGLAEEILGQAVKGSARCRC